MMNLTMRARLFLTTIALAASFAVSPALADDREDCESIELEDDEIMPACNRAIASGKYKGEQLARLLWYRGITHKIGNEQRAIADFTAAIRADPTYAAAYAARAEKYSTLNQVDLAIKDFNEAIRLSPKDGGFYFGRAYAYKYKGDRERAIADFRRVLEFLPDSTFAKKELRELGVEP